MWERVSCAAHEPFKELPPYVSTQAGRACVHPGNLDPPHSDLQVADRWFPSRPVRQILQVEKCLARYILTDSSSQAAPHAHARKKQVHLFHLVPTYAISDVSQRSPRLVSYAAGHLLNLEFSEPGRGSSRGLLGFLHLGVA